MSITNFFAVLFTVAMLATTVYFFLGGLPLLILKHDTQLDSGFIRGFINTSYLATMTVSAGASVSYACFGRIDLVIGAVIICAVSVFLRKTVIAKMDNLRLQILADDASAIQLFRSIHTKALSVNLIQFIAVLYGLTTFKL